MIWPLMQNLVELRRELELLDDGRDDHAGGGAGDARLAVEHDGRGGRGVLQHGHELVEALGAGGFVQVQGDAGGIHPLNLRKEMPLLLSVQSMT